METTTCLSSQRKQIYKLLRYDKEIEALLVKQITKDDTKTSAKDLSINDANRLIQDLTKHWARFRKENKQHMYVLSLMRQMGWTERSLRYGEIADMDRLSDFLKSKKSPVNKPLQRMNSTELSKLINCFESMLGKKKGAK